MDSALFKQETIVNRELFFVFRVNQENFMLMFDQAKIMRYIFFVMQSEAGDTFNTSWDFLRAFEPISAMGVRHLVLPSGIEIVFTNVEAGNYAQRTFNIENSPIEFSFYLSGYAQGTMIRSPYDKTLVEVSPGQAMISYNPDTRCLAQVKGCHAFQSLNIYIAPEALYSILKGDADQMPSFLYSALENQAQTPFNVTHKISPVLRMILDQIYNCVYVGTFYGIYLETKSMELILRLLWEVLACRRGDSGTSRPLSEMDRAGIRRARDILTKEVDSPPPLKELARRAGLNDTKLKRGFRQIFGTSVYGYLRKYRIEQATEYLSSGRMSVVETAHTLGFHDTAHFIHQFKQHYGTTPGTYLKQARLLS